MSACLDVTETAETYVAAATTVDVNVKVRPDLLDVKVLVGVREAFEVNACAAEIADVTLAGLRLRTVAVESTDLRAAREARRMLGLDRYDNVSYPRAIRGTLGGRFG